MRTFPRTVCLILVVSLPAFAGTLNVLTLPEKPACEGLFYGDIQGAFPGVDFNTLDRLYIPAGHYRAILINNLPQRSASHPLIISNINGQVRVGGCGHHYNLSLGGGANWHLTGQYSADRQTGHIDFRGHAEGQYADSADSYGILVDAEFGSGNIGLSVGGGASDVELSFIELRNLEFAGLMMKTDNDGNADMNNLKIHDLYIHDTLSEGVYLGSTQGQPQHKLNALQFYNNRLIRTGTEIGQFGQVGDGSRIHHNVFLFGALQWKKPFQDFQDGGIQLSHREGGMHFDHNIVIGGASNYMILFNPNNPGDAHSPDDVLDIHNNYFAYSRNRGVYIHSQNDGIKRIRFRDNEFSRVVFTYDELEPGSSGGQQIIFSANPNNPIDIVDNFYQPEPAQVLHTTGANVNGANNVNTAIGEIQFNDLGWPGSGNYFTLEIWEPVDKHGQPIEYQSGDLVLHLGDLYAANSAIDYAVIAHTPPEADPTHWSPRPRMRDDVRLAPGAAHLGIGLLDVVPGNDLIFAGAFDD